MNTKISKINKNQFFLLTKNILLYLFIISLFVPKLNSLFVIEIHSNEILNNLEFIFNRSLSFYTQIFLIIIYIVEILVKRKTFFISNIGKVICLILLYSLLVNIVFFQSFKYIISINYYYPYILNILFMILLVNDNKHNPAIIKNISLLMIVLSSLLSLSITTGILTFTNAESNRITLMGWKENDLGFILSIGYALIASYLVDNKFKSAFKPIILIISSIFIINGILLTGTRASIFVVSFVLAIITLSLFKKPINKNIKIILLISNLSFYLSKTTTYKPITERFFVDNFTTFGGRIEHWLISLKLANANPAFGQGVEKYSASILEFFDSRRYGMPENLFFEIYVTAGIFALTLLFLLITYCIVNSFYIYLKTKKLDLIICSIPLLSSAFILNIRHYKVFFAFLGLYLMKEIIYKKELKITMQKLIFISRSNN